ncbi:baseplate J/gp47 family protein [Erwinia sp. ErVv1]|uniref:baseplate J/gp47 family protein n=1 Tax=Erwinia sp. ErVv1 TaxID=1603299 RepID=UPI00082DF210|nr:baseplate J/gp47 family protein [Erwinia sp. ErVv1]
MALNLSTLGLSATITAQGIAAPGYQAILSTLTGYFQQIYGSDAYLEPDSKDGQMLAIVALAIHDTNNAVIHCYNAFSPSTAMGDALSRNVKINGITRQGATSSVVDVTLTGIPGTTISNGSVRDSNGVIWNLPDSVTIGTASTATVTATCASAGAVVALPGTVNGINTPTRGWTSVTNIPAATPGTAAETDSELRLRQTQSVALASLTPFDALDAAIASVPGVTNHRLYENDTGTADAHGIPAHAIAAIVDGGDVTAIAQVLRGKKGQGTATWGSSTLVVSDKYGNPHSISFSRPSDVPVHVAIVIRAFTGYTTQIGEDMKTAIAAYINGLAIGEDVLLSRLYSPANLADTSGGAHGYYDITQLQIGRSAASMAVANIAVAYNESASVSRENITIEVTV